jgi:hypothetical protein
VIPALTEPAADQFLIALEVDEPHAVVPAEILPVRRFEGGARNHRALARGEAAGDFLADLFEPGPTIRIGEWNAAPHPVDVVG